MALCAAVDVYSLVVVGELAPALFALDLFAIGVDKSNTSPDFGVDDGPVSLEWKPAFAKVAEQLHNVVDLEPSASDSLLL